MLDHNKFKEEGPGGENGQKDKGHIMKSLEHRKGFRAHPIGNGQSLFNIE